MPNSNQSTKINAAFYHALGKVLTESANLVGNELYKSAHNVRASEIWMDPIPYAPTIASASQYSDNVIVKEIGGTASPAYIFPLTNTNYQSWFIDTGTPTPAADGFVPSANWAKPLISPSDVPDDAGAPSYGFELKMYRKDGTTPISYGNAFFDVDYFSGLIRFDVGKTPIDPSNGLGFTFDKAAFEATANPSKQAYIQSTSTGGPRVVAWQYVGQRLTSGSISGSTVSFAETLTIGYTQSGITYSFFVKPGSLTASILNTGLNGGATAGYFLSVDSNGDFTWSEVQPGVTFEESVTVGFTQSGTTHSFSVKESSLTASLLDTGSNGGATAGYILSNTSDGKFAWVPNSGGGGSQSLTVIDYATGASFSDVQSIIFRGGLVSVPPSGTATGVLASGPSPAVTVWIPAPPPAVYASHFNTNDGNTAGGVSRSLSVSSVRISSPDSEGSPFKTGGWAGTTNPATIQSTPSFSTGGLVTGFSGTSSGNSTITVKVFDADGASILTSYTTPVLYQNGSHNSGDGITVNITGYAVDDSGFPAIYETKYKAAVGVSVNMATIFGSYSLDGGRYSVSISHYSDIETDTGITYSYTAASVFYDTNPSTASISGNTSIVESTTPSNIITKHISGVEYYTTGSQFEVTTTGINNLNRNTQGFSGGDSKNFTLTAQNYNIPSYNLRAWSPTIGTFHGWSNLYTNTGLTFSYTSWAISASSTYRYRGSGARVSSQNFDPWNVGTTVLSTTASILIDQVSDNSARLGEGFNGENERLLRGSTTYSVWDSTATLGSGISNQTGTGPFCDACIVGGYLVTPNNYFLTDPSTSTILANLTSFKPDKGGSNPNYSSYTQIATYHRRFYTSDVKNFASFAMHFSGSFGASINATKALEDSQLKIYIRRIDSVSSPAGQKGPTASPLSLHGGLFGAGGSGAPYDDGLSGIDTPGSWIRTDSSSGNVVVGSFGSLTAKTGFWAEIQIVDGDIKIDSINVVLNFADGSSSTDAFVT